MDSEDAALSSEQQDRAQWSRNPTRRFADGLVPTTIVPGIWDVLSSGAAKRAGATHVFLGGAAFDNTHGYPDRSVLDIADYAKLITEITAAIDLPTLVDVGGGPGGGVAKLARLFDELARAGTTAVMLEDQEETGITKSATRAALSDPDLLCERIDLLREVVGDEIDIVARTDFLPGMEWEESLSRMRRYEDAGADWLNPVFPPSLEALKEAAAIFPDKLIVLSASPPTSGVMRYVPTKEDFEELKPLAIISTGQYRDTFAAMQRIFEMSLNREWLELFSGRPDPVELDQALGITRRGMR